MQHAQVVSLPVNCQSLCESAKLYDPGKKFSEYVKNLPKYDVPTEPVCFETQSSQVGGWDIRYILPCLSVNMNQKFR